MLAGGCVKARGGTANDERARSKGKREADTAAEKDAVANIEGSAAIVSSNVEWIRREIRSAGSIAIGIVQSVVAEKREGEFCGPGHANTAVHDELILAEDTSGFELVVNLTRWRGDNCAGRHLSLIRKPGVKLTFSARVEIGDGQVGGLRQLALQGHSSLHGLRSVHVRINVINRLRRNAGGGN